MVQSVRSRSWVGMSRDKPRSRVWIQLILTEDLARVGGLGPRMKILFHGQGAAALTSAMIHQRSLFFCLPRTTFQGVLMSNVSVDF